MTANGGETRDLLSRITDRFASLPAGIVSALAAVAFADLFFARFVTAATRALPGFGLSRRRQGDLALVLGVGVPAAVLIAVVPQLRERLLGAAATTRTAASAGGRLFERTTASPASPSTSCSAPPPPATSRSGRGASPDSTCRKMLPTSRL